MTMQALLDRINELVESMNAPGITLWGGYYDLINLAEVLGGEVLEVEPSTGCGSETCRHVSHSPAAPTYKWVPPQGVKLIHLGGETEADGEIVEWYGVFSDDTVHFLEVRDSRVYHGSARLVDNVPEWALLTLKGEQE